MCAQVCPPGYPLGCCPSPCGPCPSSCDPCQSFCDPCCPPMCPPKVNFLLISKNSNSYANFPQRCRSRELRGGNLITNCDCVKRNGLQYDCLRSECRGRPMCTTKPIPACCPSKYMWRYTNVTMGKPAYPVGGSGGCPKAECCVGSCDIMCCL